MTIPKSPKIRRAIERKRKEMYLLSDRYGIHSEKVIRKSQELDVLLNKYTKV